MPFVDSVIFLVTQLFVGALAVENDVRGYRTAQVARENSSHCAVALLSTF